MTDEPSRPDELPETPGTSRLGRYVGRFAIIFILFPLLIHILAFIVWFPFSFVGTALISIGAPFGLIKNLLLILTYLIAIYSSFLFSRRAWRSLGSS